MELKLVMNKTAPETYALSELLTLKATFNGMNAWGHVIFRKLPTAKSLTCAV